MEVMLGLGIAAGLGAALCQALSYLATRHFVQVRGGGIRMLMILGHVIMGVISAVVLPWIWPGRTAVGTAFLSPLFWCSAWCVLGQLGLTALLKYAEPSRVSPMLAFKLVILAALTILVAQQPITLLQWVAIGLCIAGALALNYTGASGTRLSAAAGGLLVFTCIAYSLSDWNIGRLVMAMGEMEPWRAFTCSALASYTLCGIAGTALLPWYGSKRKADWVEAAPFAASWLLAMLLLFACFGMVGVVYGNILQSTRGLISLGLGAVSVKLGFLHLESATSRSVFMRRLTATLMMTAAVILYAVGKQKPRPAEQTSAPQRETESPPKLEPNFRMRHFVAGFQNHTTGLVSRPDLPNIPNHNGRVGCIGN